MWKRKKTQPSDNQPSALSAHVGARLTQLQRNWAGRLNGRTAHWSRRQKIIFGLLACGALAGLNLLALVDDGSTMGKLYQKSNPVPIPKHWHTPEVSHQYNAADSAIFMAFRARMDSLMSTETGRERVADFQKKRPGFLDSLMRIERQLFPTLPPIKIFSPIKPLQP